MQEAMHTPGPWKWWDRKSGRPKKYDLSKLIGPNNEFLLTLYGGSGFKAMGRSRFAMANARLIAAAPELLEALREIQEFCDDPEGSEKGESLALGMSRLLPKARAAIAKATGEAA